MTPQGLRCSQQQFKSVTSQRLWFLCRDVTATDAGAAHPAGPGVTTRQAGASATYSTTGADAAITADRGAMYSATDAGAAYAAGAGATKDTAGAGVMYLTTGASVACSSGVRRHV